MDLMCRYSGVKAIASTRRPHAYPLEWQNSMNMASFLLLKSLLVIKKLKLHGKKSDITDRYYFPSMPAIFNEVWSIGSKRPLRKGRKANYALVTREEKEASDKSSPYAKAAQTPQK
jgi:hypothetical protein